MADLLNSNPIKIPDDVKKRLTDTIDTAPALKEKLASLKKVGIDTTGLEEQLKYAEDMSKEILKTFS